MALQVQASIHNIFILCNFKSFHPQAIHACSVGYACMKLAMIIVYVLLGICVCHDMYTCMIQTLAVIVYAFWLGNY